MGIKNNLINMKLSVAFLAAVAHADEKKVPPRHPLQRLKRLTQFSEEILNDWYSFLPSKDAWINKFAKNAERMERNFKRGNQRCGYYDEGNRYDREDPAVGTRQNTTGYRKWAQRYMA